MLVPVTHPFLGLSTFSRLHPQINTKVRVSLAFEPDATTSKPPHGKGARLDQFMLDFFVEPCSPFGKTTQNPGFSCYVRNIHRLLFAITLLNRRSQRRWTIFTTCLIIMKELRIDEEY